MIIQQQGTVFWFRSELTSPGKKRELKTLLCYTNNNCMLVWGCFGLWSNFGGGFFGLFFEGEGGLVFFFSVKHTVTLAEVHYYISNK